MRTVFMGNPSFAIPTLKAIQNSEHSLTAIVSNPPKPMGRGRQLRSTPVGEFAKENNIKLIEPSSLQSSSFKKKLFDLRPDIFVIVAYRILPKEIINIPKNGSINLHASLLPKYRGAAPIQWALMNGEKVSGVTIFQISKKVDTGKILLQKEMEIYDYDNMYTLGTRLCSLGAGLIINVLDEIDKNSIKMIEQNHSLVSFAPKINKEMRLINWHWASIKIHNWVRGLSPMPGMYTYLGQKLLRIYKTSFKNNTICKPGKVLESEKQFLVGTGSGVLEILELQLEGRKKLLAKDFIRGINITPGQILGG